MDAVTTTPEISWPEIWARLPIDIIITTAIERTDSDLTSLLNEDEKSIKKKNKYNMVTMLGPSFYQKKNIVYPCVTWTVA